MRSRIFAWHTRASLGALTLTMSMAPGCFQPGDGSDTNAETDSDGGPTSTMGTMGTADDTTGGTADPTVGTTMGGSADDGSSSDSSDDMTQAELQFIQIDPTNAVLEVDIDTPGMLPYTVLGFYTDGSQVELTAEVESWTVDNPTVGTMNGSNFESPPFADTFFDSTIITATIGDEEAQAQLTVAAYRQTGDQQDFFFLLPHNDTAGPQDKPLTFSTDVQSLDVFFNMDTTGSMSGPINNLQSSLTSTVIPTIETQISDTFFGAGTFEDFPVAGFGEMVCDYFGPTDPDQPFELFVEMTDVSADVQAAVNGMSLVTGQPIGCGADGPESNIEALYQIATGEGLMGPGITNVPPNMSGVGGVGFREGAMPVIVSITDAVSHENDASNTCLGTSYDDDPSTAAVAHDRQQTYDALGDICARVVPVAVSNFSTTCGPLVDGQDFATETGAIIPPDAWDLAPGGRPPGCPAGQCCTGIDGDGVPTDGAGLCPLVYRVNFDGSGLGQSIVDGVQMLAAYSPFDVTTQVDGVDADVDGAPLPPGFTTADFIQAVTPFDHGPVPLPGAPPPVLTPDAFEGVIPNTPVTFTITAFNDFVPAGPEPRLFIADITVLADGCSDLDTRQVLILVPPEELAPPK